MILSLRYHRNAVIIRFSLEKKGLMALSARHSSLFTWTLNFAPCPRFRWRWRERSLRRRCR